MGKLALWIAEEKAEREADDARRGVERTSYGTKRIVGASHPQMADYKCDGCGLVTEDVYFKGRDAVTETLECPSCGNEAHRVILRTNFIHPSISTLYGREQPALGYGNEDSVIHDYADKKRIMQKYDLVESNDSVGGNRHLSEERKHEAWQNQKRRDRSPGSVWVNGPEE